jgi:hypothetical protein
MAITNFIPEVWAAQLLKSFVAATKFASPMVCNRDYEGEIGNSGDVVHITSIGMPSITAYVKGVTTLSFEQLTDASRALNVDQCDSFAFEVDDIDKRQSANGGALMSEAANLAGQHLATHADAYVMGIIGTDTDAGNIVGATSITTSALAVARLVAHRQMLDEHDVPVEGRYTICPSWFHSLLALDTGFMAYDALSGAGMLRNGVVGRMLGFEIVQANYALTGGDDWRVYSGHPSAVTFADQINEVEALRPQTSFGDALKGLHVYGAKVTRPSALCYTLCSVT